MRVPERPARVRGLGLGDIQPQGLLREHSHRLDVNVRRIIK